jgi:tetratricopeptide (TPR) repeat protein
MPRSTLRLLVFGVVAGFGSAGVAAAQCPDGTPPPCGGRSAPVVRRDPPLDDRAWLILPFANTTGAADAAMLSQASVSILYQDLARWQDVRVVPDDRVADLVRELPPAERTRPGLQAALGLARRVGAGRLVLGDFLAVGGQAQLNAKVYEVRSGRQLRLVREQLSSFTSLDSLTAGFGRVARGALAVPGPALSKGGAGTTSLQAYAAYLSGMEALKDIRIDSARARFLRATQIDSTFALAHFRASQTRIRFIGGGSVLTDPNRLAALRFSATLPPRERAMLQAVAAATRNDAAEHCRIAQQLVAADSSDVEAWNLLSSCHNDVRLIVGPGGDSTRAVARGNLTAALAAGRRVYSLDPTGPWAGNFASLMSLGAGPQCLFGVTGLCPPNQLYAAAGWIVGDSAWYEGSRWTDAKQNPPYAAPAWVTNYQARMTQVRDLYRRMAASKPGNWILERNVAAMSLQLGDTAAAASEFVRALAIAPDSARIFSAAERRDLALARQRPSEALALAESTLALPPAVRNVSYFTVLGRPSAEGDSTQSQRETATWRQILLGVLPPGFDSLEAAIAARLTDYQRDDFLQLSTLAGFHLRRRGPALDTAARHPVKRFQAWMARGDTARARAALAEFDKELLARHRASFDDGGWLFNAESHLELGDSTTALSRLMEWERRWVFLSKESMILEQFYWQRSTPRLFGRTWLLYGDLAMARGRRQESARAYQMVVGLWANGEPPVQPAVQRARDALTRLGARP